MKLPLASRADHVLRVVAVDSAAVAVFTPDEISRAVALLEAIADDRALLAAMPDEQRRVLLIAAGRISRPTRDEHRRLNKAFRRLDRVKSEARDRELRAGTEIRVTRQASVFVAPPQLVAGEGDAPASARVLETPRDCYVCKAPYTQLHFFYDAMCPPCAALNYQKRFQTASLEGKVALITGARIKIGYQAALMMLRAGAHVIVTTRFPRDAEQRYAREKDYAKWQERLEVHGLDLRHSPSVELFAAHLVATKDRLDILVNNAAQTVRRPTAFYKHLIDCEKLSDEAPVAALPWAYAENREDALVFFPKGQVDADLQQIDLRTTNSWRLKLADVPSAEMLEVQLINAVAPFILCSKLKPLMMKVPTRDKHVVNVSAMEGQFARGTKTDKHPHTNMAKAALNMLTLTSAPDYARDGIFMNAVDTGWVTDEDPFALSQRKQERHDFQPPLDIVDGAARVCDPFFSGLNTGEHVFGKFLKDYSPCAW
jgi:NAD(P)-dependent dehydrogenase (short-subunit alcohol dehydrogenase family)